MDLFVQGKGGLEQRAEAGPERQEGCMSQHTCSYALPSSAVAVSAASLAQAEQTWCFLWLAALLAGDFLLCPWQ